MINICDLPDEILLRLLRLLAFNERVRIGRVNRNFQRISSIIVSQTRTLDFSNDVFRRLTDSVFRSLIKLCSNQLQNVKFNSTVDHSKINIFADFTCPNLLELIVGHDVNQAKRYERIGIRTFAAIVQKNGNLKRLEWDFNYAVFPDDVISEKLEFLRIGACDDRTLPSFIGRCVNLKHFETFLQVRSKENLHDFFAGCPNLRSFVSKSYMDLTELTRVESFWHLDLRELVIVDCYQEKGVQSNGIAKIASSFPKLEILKLSSVDVIHDGISSLCVSENLRILILIGRQHTDVDTGLQRIAAGCVRLEKLAISADISPITLIALINRLRRLRILAIRSVRHVIMGWEAGTIATSFEGTNNCNLILSICDEHCLRIWKSHHVTMILKDLEAKGRVIQIVGYNLPFYVDISENA